MACAERLIPCFLELGGKDPAIVTETADLDRAGVPVAFGQDCVKDGFYPFGRGERVTVRIASGWKAPSGLVAI